MDDTFLREAFGQALDQGDEDRPILAALWSLPSKKSRWSNTLQDALYCAESLDTAGEDVYIHVALAGVPQPATTRLKASDTIGLVGLWADVDIADPVHSGGKPLASDLTTAIAIVESVLLPTTVIHSGHGVQAWWLFEEPWLFDSPNERKDAAALIEAWQARLRVAAEPYKASVDPTQDLARVLRVPGTHNRKAEPVEVRVLDDHTDWGRRYATEHFEPLLLGPFFGASSNGTAEGWHSRGVISGQTDTTTPPLPKPRLVVSASAEPPGAKFRALEKNEPKFKKVFDRDPTAGKGWSPSEYDFSLTNTAIDAGWSDQEIVDLLIASRRESNQDMKLRESYYELTVRKARRDKKSDEASQALDMMIEEVNDEVRETGRVELTPERREEIMAVLSANFGFQLERILQYVGPDHDTDGAMVSFVTASRHVRIGTTASLIDQKKLRDKLAEAWKVYLAHFKQPRWAEIAEFMLRIVEEIEIQAEAGASGQVRSWLSGYIAQASILSSIEDAQSDRNPFWDKSGKLCIFGDSFREWLALRGERVNQKQMGAQLWMCGVRFEERAVKLGKLRTTRGIWVLPHALTPAFDTAEVVVAEERRN